MYYTGDKVLHLDSNVEYKITRVKPLYDFVGNSQFVLTLENEFGNMLSCLDEKVAKVIEDEATDTVVIDYTPNRLRRW